jgi:hypothetical protein
MLSFWNGAFVTRGRVAGGDVGAPGPIGYPRMQMEPTTEPQSQPEPLPEPLPAPLPEPPEQRDVRVLRPARAGNLTTNWSTAFWLGWALVAGGFAAVWYSSRITGMATWWLGPETAPRLIFVSLIPFVAPIGLAVMTLTHRRWLPFWGILGAAITAGVAIGDIGGPARYAAIEFALAAGGLLVSVASIAGLLRDAPTDPTSR